MSSPFRHVAPAGAPIRLADLVRTGGLTISGRDVSAHLRDEFRRRFGVRHVFLTSTGRAGMTILLRALRRQADSIRNEVILPSYTCFSVAASVVKAGLRPRIVDIDIETLDYSPAELEAVEFSRVLAVVACNLYGIPNDLQTLRRITQKNGVFLVDDAAQSLGAVVGGRWSGTCGDVGLFSLDKGKNVSAIDGGVVVTDDASLASALEREIGTLSSPRLVDSVVHAAKAAAYCLLLRPSLYWIPNSVPQLGLGRTVFSTDFALETPTRALSALGASMLPRLDGFTRTRVANALSLIAQLRTTGLQMVIPRADTVPVYLRLPVLMPDEPARRRALAALSRAGIGATASYPASLVDVPELQDVLAGPVPGATRGREVAQRILTLPTHSFVGAGDIARATAVLRAEIESTLYRQSNPAA
jgi:perosamine synthetase